MELFLSSLFLHGVATNLLKHHREDSGQLLFFSYDDYKSTSSERPKNAPDIVNRTLYAVSRNPYEPLWYCFLDWYGQVQTTLQFFLRNAGKILSNVRYDREIFMTEDGGSIALDWAILGDVRSNENLSPDSTMPTIIMHHGLCGDSSSEHIIHLVERLLGRSPSKPRYRVVVVVARGCGGLKLTNPKPMMGARTSDLKAAIQHIRKLLPKAKLFGIGFSLGAALTLKYLGQSGPDAGLDAAMVVSPPWDANKPTPWFPTWSVILAIPIKLYVLTHREVLNKLAEEDGITLSRILMAWDLIEIDRMHAKRYGYDTIEEYLKACSPLPYVQNITVPTLAISAIDDPVCNHEPAPTQAQIATGNLVVVKTKVGGHLGFQAVNKCPHSSLRYLSTTCWTDDIALDFFDSFVEYDV